MRAIKAPDEIEQIRSVQRATEEAMERGIALIRGSTPKGGILHRNGQPLTAEAVRTEIHVHLLTRGCRGADTIVSCGPDTALPHNLGTGPLLEGEPIVIDIFPQDELSGYYADMTRTVAKGEPSPEIRDMYEAVRDARLSAPPGSVPGSPGPTSTTPWWNSSATAVTRAIRRDSSTASVTGSASRCMKNRHSVPGEGRSPLETSSRSSPGSTIPGSVASAWKIWER